MPGTMVSAWHGLGRVILTKPYKVDVITVFVVQMKKVRLTGVS